MGCDGAVKAGVAKAAAFIKSKFPKVDAPAANKCLVGFGKALCAKAVKKACGRRLFSVPAPIKKAFTAVAGAVKPDAEALFKCLVAAAKAKALSVIKAKLGSWSSLFGLRRNLWSVMGKLKSAAGKLAGAAKGAACKAFAGKAQSMCDGAVKAGVAKAAAFIKSKFPKVDAPAANKCLVGFGKALCAKAVKKACGRRLFSVPAPIKKAFTAVAGAVKPDAEALFKCLVAAAKAKALSVIKAKLGSWSSLFGLR